MAEVDAELQEVVNEIFKDPAAAVKKASTPSGREFLPLSALTLTVQDPDLWPQLRDAGFLNLFIELLVDDWTSPRVEVVCGLLPECEMRRRLLIVNFCRRPQAGSSRSRASSMPWYR